MHEHLASAVVRTILGGLLESVTNVPPSAPTIVVTTPVGQLHEIGAMVVAAMAAAEGWHVTYLGVNLPAEDIAAAVQQQHAKAVALSVAHPADDPHLEHELTLLRRYLTQDVGLIVGGRAAEGYHKVLEAIGAIRVQDMAGFRAHLETLRTGKRVS
jgi:methanogenic corrinoid protein MtbC1